MTNTQEAIQKIIDKREARIAAYAGPPYTMVEERMDDLKYIQQSDHSTIRENITVQEPRQVDPCEDVVDVEKLKHLCGIFKNSSVIERMILTELERAKREIAIFGNYNILHLQENISRIIDDKTKSSKGIYEWIKKHLTQAQKSELIKSEEQVEPKQELTQDEIDSRDVS